MGTTEENTDTLRGRALRMASGAMALAALIAVRTYQISGAPIESDPAATVQTAANLLRHNSISLDAQAPVQPSMYREPLPVLTTAFAMSISDAVKAARTWRSIFRSQALRAR